MTHQMTTRVQDIDRHVGARIRELRIMLGLTQQQLADLIGVTYQQAHKYERGINRVSAGRLFQIARALGVPVGSFFEGIDGPQSKPQSARERMCLELAKNFSQFRTSAIKRRSANSRALSPPSTEAPPRSAAPLGALDGSTDRGRHGDLWRSSRVRPCRQPAC